MEEGETFQFPSTCWSEVVAAGSLNDPAGRAALGNLVQRYQPSLVAYIRKRFCSGNDDAARELFQKFVAEIVVDKGLIGHARPIKGNQFRSFLLRSLHNFAVSAFRKEFAEKRHPTGGMESLDERAELGQTVPAETPEANFDLEWARGVVTRAVTEMEKDCRKEGLPHIWSVFESRLLNPLLNGSPEVSYTELVERFKFTSPAQAHNAMVTAKRKFAQCLRRVIGEYVPDEASIEVELSELLEMLQHRC